MSYTAETFNVMIASPGDVASERTIVRDVIYEWNAVNSSARKIVLLPIGWESHSSPEMGASPQAIINQQILGKCDLLIGVFWTRIGTPTDEYASGTVEELEKHIESGKPAMLYFSSQPVAMDSVDLDQAAAVKKFKTDCQSRGLYESYDSLSDFRTKLYRHLQLKVNEHPLFNNAEQRGLREIIESKTSIPKLSGEARILLKEASLDSHGTIIHVDYMEGTDVQTNGKNLVAEKSDRREVAKWEQAIAELTNEGLIVGQGYKGEIYQVTNLGYQIADMIAL
ncbi:hypothetical protein [Pseudomonas sp. URMO17WK12:I11]|uniref:hypothetical protein n=1 Tax=Pseudomonas sp. URMO17WK12:I11 TaxID=1283291 RepID=UPI0007217C3B|nr:hypothetical protein [Pseudomonas sp. URMO17WK12:I11]CRL48926.1 hypothetical protein PSHI_20050 [Pseudomonas sp. URMO17WK12:I11]